MVSDAQGQRHNQAELMPSVIDVLHSQSDVEFLRKTLRSRIDYLPGHHRSHRIHVLQLRIPPEIEPARIDEQGPNLVERCCDILNWTNAQHLHARNVS
jgi:hypothetical protein